MKAPKTRFNRQAKKFAMATASRTPPTRVQRILSDGREARALTLTMTAATATLSSARMETTTSTVAFSFLRQVSFSVIGVITLMVVVKTASRETSSE